jgi:hypothetical protein
MRISPVATVAPRYQAPRIAQAAAPQPPRPVQAAEGPPPEYSLWSILKDIGTRIKSFFTGLFD